MKKPMLLCILLLCVFISNAQIYKGSASRGLFMNGSFNTNSSGSFSTSYSWSINPTLNFEYFIKDNQSIGFLPGFNYSHYVYDNHRPAVYGSSPIYTYNSSTGNYGLGLFYKKYWFVTSKLAIYILPKLSSTYNESRYEYEFKFPTTYKTIRYQTSWNHALNLSMGLNYFITPNISLMAQSVLSQYTLYRNSQSFILLNPTLSFTFGVNYYLLNKSNAKK